MSTKQVHMPRIAPAIDGVHIEVSGIRIGRREAAHRELRKYVVELCKRKPEALCSCLRRNVSWFNSKPHDD